MGRRWLAPEDAAELGRLDPEAIARVREEAWPDAANARRAARCAGLARLPDRRPKSPPARAGGLAGELARASARRADRAAAHRAARADGARTGGRRELWVAAERLPQFLRAVARGARSTRRSQRRRACASGAGRADEALVEIAARPARRARPGRPRPRWPRRSASRPATSPRRSPRLQPKASCCAAASRRARATRRMVRAPAARAHPPLHAEAAARRDRAGRGARLPALPVRLAARDRRRPAWQGPDALAAVLGQLEGFEAPAGAWETEILPARVADYEPAWLDDLCLAGRIAWARLRPRNRATGRRRGSGAAPVRTTPDHAAGAPARAAVDRAVAGARSGAGRARARRAVADFIRDARRVVLRRDRRGHAAAAPAGRGGARRAGRARPRQLATASPACARC